MHIHCVQSADNQQQKSITSRWLSKAAATKNQTFRRYAINATLTPQTTKCASGAWCSSLMNMDNYICAMTKGRGGQIFGTGRPVNRAGRFALDSAHL